MDLLKVIRNESHLLEVHYKEKYISTLVKILRNNNANYSVNRKQKTVRVYRPQKKCKLEVLGFISKHRICDVCNSHRAKYKALKDGKEVVICSFCKKDLSLKVIEKLPYCQEIHHDIATGILRVCY